MKTPFTCFWEEMIKPSSLVGKLFNQNTKKATICSKTSLNSTNKTSKTIEFVEELLLQADKKEFETKQFSDYKDQFQWFLGFGLVFLALDVFLLNKKTKWIQKLNLFNER